MVSRNARYRASSFPASSIIVSAAAPRAGSTFETSSRIRRALWCEDCELTLESLGGAHAPGLGNGLRRGIRKDLLVASRQPIEDARRDRFRRRLRNLETAVHVCVDRTEDDAVHGDSLAREERSQRLGHVERG